MERGGHSLVATPRFLIAVASLVVEHGLEGMQAAVIAAPRLSSCGSWTPEPRLSACGARA